MMREYACVYLIGIGGIGMSAVARWFHAQAWQVFGYDRASTALTDQLVQEGMWIHFEDSPDAIPTAVTHQKETTIVIYTSAISPKNQILAYLREHRYMIRKRSEILGEITRDYPTLAVAGTHGKTTTSALAAHILHSAGKDVTAFLGGIAKGYESNLFTCGKLSKETVMVVEADEFDRSFLCLQPRWAIVTTVDSDHLDTYGNWQNLREAFRTFIEMVPTTGCAVVHKEAAQRLRIEAPYPSSVHYALTDAAIRAENISIEDGDFYFDYVSRELTIRGIRLAVPGYHNIENALAVITICTRLGLVPDAIRKGMATFQGTKRRFEYVIRQEGLIFLDDYAHHPVEISAVLKTIRAIYPSKEITVVFRPNLYTRTRDLAEEFAKSLDRADRVILLDVYPDREEGIQGISSALIFHHMALRRKTMCQTGRLLHVLDKQGKPEVLVTMGSGGTSNLIPLIRQFITSRWID